MYSELVGLAFALSNVVDLYYCFIICFYKLILDDVIFVCVYLMFGVDLQVSLVYMGLALRGLLCVKTARVQFTGDTTENEQPIKAK